MKYYCLLILFCFCTKVYPLDNSSDSILITIKYVQDNIKNISYKIPNIKVNKIIEFEQPFNFLEKNNTSSNWDYFYSMYSAIPLTYANGYLWISAPTKGLIKLKVKTDSLIYLSRLDGLIGNRVTDLKVYNDDIWVTTSSGIGYFNGEKWKSYFVKASFLCIEKNKGDTIYFGGKYSPNLVKKLPDGNWQKIENNLEVIYDIKITADDTLYVVGGVLGGYQYLWKGIEKDNRIDFIKCFDISIFPPKILLDNNENIWFINDRYKGNVYLYNYNKNKLIKFDSTNSNFNPPIYNFGLDNYNKLWVVAQNGIHVFNKDTWISYPYPSRYGKLSPSLTPIVFDESNNLYFSASYYSCIRIDSQPLSIRKVKFMKWNPTNWKEYQFDSGPLNSNYVVDILHDSKDRLWIAQMDFAGVLYLNENGWHRYYATSNSGPVNNFVFDIHEDYNGNVWFSSHWVTVSGGNCEGVYPGGVAKFDGSNWSKFTNPKFGTSLIESDIDGNVWLYYPSNKSGSIAMYDGETWTIFGQDAYPYPSGFITLLVKHKGYIWWKTPKKIMVYKKNKWEIYDTTNTMLPSIGDILNADVDQNNNIWFLYKDALVVFKDSIWKIYNASNSGFPLGDVARDLKVDKMGNIWIITDDNRLIVFNGSDYWHQVGFGYFDFARILFDWGLDHKGNPILIFQEYGFLIYESDKKLWHKFNMNNSPLIADIYEAWGIDKRNNIYLVGGMFSDGNMGVSIYNMDGVYLPGANYIESSTNRIVMDVNRKSKHIKEYKIDLRNISNKPVNWTAMNYSQLFKIRLDTSFGVSNKLFVSFTKRDTIPSIFLDSIKIHMSDGVNSPLIIKVRCNLIEDSAFIYIDSSKIKFNAIYGYNNPKPQKIFVRNLGKLPMNWEYHFQSDWLEGKKILNNNILELRVKTTKLLPGIYMDTLKITSKEAVNSPYFIPIFYEVKKNLDMVEIKTLDSLLFTSIRKGVLPKSKKLVIKSKLDNFYFSWRIKYKPNWLVILPQKNESVVRDTLVIFVNTNDLSVGTHKDSIKIYVLNIDSIFTLPVYYKIKNAPSILYLHQNYPNPFNNYTKIKFEIPRITNVKLKIYNVWGQKIATLVNQMKKPGIYEVLWEPKNLNSGIYFYQIEANGKTEVRKLLYIK